MSQARPNLLNNPLYTDAVKQVNNHQEFKDMKITLKDSDPLTEADSCLFCHGTEVKVEGTVTVEHDMGDMEVPVLSGWPNQGVGRLNPDGSNGSCAACHTRHQFSIEMARKPHTCSECHKGPDVPAYAVYKVSKHGNIYSSKKRDWDFNKVPWTVGENFRSPTCATCHISLLVDGDENVISQRTHQMNDRLPWRLFGIPYAHAHPKSPDTSIIRNKAGLPLASELTGEPVSEFLIDAEEQGKRRGTMKNICLSCHGYVWVKGHFDRLENTIKTSNRMTLTATKIMMTAWEKNVARGLDKGDSIFNEGIEKKWVETWLFYANSIRLASAMAGADYGVFANGRWYLSKNTHELLDLIKIKASRP
jgi:hypothetical protein